MTKEDLLNVINFSNWTYFNSEKISTKVYDVEISASLYEQLLPSEYKKRTIKEDEVVCIQYRKSVLSEEQDQFLIEKFNKNNFMLLQQKEIQIDVELKNEIKNICNSYIEPQSNNSYTDEILDKIRAAGIEVVTDKDEFDRILQQKEKLQKMSSSFSKIDFGTVEQWQIEEAKDIGLDLSDYKHQITSEFITHVIKHHGNQITEASRGNIAITKDDLKSINEMITSADRVVYGVTRKEIVAGQLIDRQRIIYAKNQPDGTSLYFEEVLEGKKNKRLRGKTFFKRNGSIDDKSLLAILGNNKKRDNIEKAIIKVHPDVAVSSLSQHQNVDVAAVSTVSELNESISDFVDKSITDYVNSKIQTYTVNSQIYSFVHNGKIYLNSEIMNSNAAVHEYTHLWDAYTQKTNPELWNKGLELFKDSKYWNEVISDPNYQDINDDENLVLSEIHSRICGDIAEKVLNRIAELDGEQVKLDTIDWDEETWKYITEEMGFQQFNNVFHRYPYINPELEIRTSNLKDFLSTPMKDLMSEKKISVKKELNISEEEAVRIQLAREIRQNMPNLSDGERAAALAILEAGAASMKMTLRDYVQTTFPLGVFGDFDKAQNAAQQQGVEINGAVSVSGFGANARAVIYASKTADFSTWCHELSHIWQVQLTGELKVNAEKVFQVQNGNWQESTYTFADGHTDTSAEAFAYGFEDFLKHKAGEMAAEDKKAIFEKFADYMSRTYNGVKENIKVNEDIAKVYEQFVQLDDNILAEAEKAVRMEKDLYDSKKNINALLNSPDLRSSKKVSKTLGYVSPQFSRLAKQYGYDIEGFRHTIDNFFINHANNRHSTARTETARGNVAITNDDILNIAKVYESPDYIIFGTKTKTGNPAIVYAKNMGNATVFVEDVRSGKKELAAETLYKKSGAIDVSSKKEAPELYAHSDPESISIVDVKKEFVNHIANGELIFQAAYHGSGASFDHFDTEHYGLSGEGSMSFGWGTYLTESEAIARDYADRQNGIGKKLDSLLKKYPDLYSHITPIYNHMSLGDSFEEAKKNYVGYLRENHIPGIRKITKSIEELKAEDFAELFKKDRNLYTVSIPDGKYLSWNNDVPEATKTEIAEKLHSHLVESDPESYSGNAANYLRQELESLFESEMDGQRFYGSLADYLGSERQASEFLKESGYTGISYPAGTIYGNGNGATNYVIFNDDDIEIKEHLQFQTRTTEQKERKKIEVQTYKFQNGETIDEILSKQTSWATDAECLDNMIDNSLREVADFADEKENELLKKISIAKNNPEVDLKLLAIQTDAAARYMAAKHYDYRLADIEKRPFSKDFINTYAQDDFPYELPSWMKNHLEEYPNQNVPEHTSEEEKAYQEWEEMLEDNQREENIISHNVLKTKDSEKNISNTQREENSYLNSEELKSSLKKALNEIAKPLEVIPFTRENYNLLFPHSHIISPIENVKLGEHQFEKLDIKERQHILKAVHDTVATPDIIINEKRKTVFDDEKEAHVYAKAFKIDGKNKAVQSVVVSIEDENVSISTHLREINNVVNKIKMPEQLIFASTEIGQMVERLTGKQLGTVNPTRENEIFAPPVTTIPQNTENSINYHGLTLTKEATDTIQTVIARNSYALEHSSIREQVGAVIESIALDNEKSTIKNNNEKSKERHSDAKDYLIQTTRLFLSKLKEKNLPFLKGKEQGSIIIIKPQVVRDAATGKAFTGYTQLMAQALIQTLYDQKKLPELEYDLITYDQAKACGTFIKKGSPHITLTNYNRTTNSASKQMYYFKSGCNSPEMIELHKESIARNRAIKRIRLSLEEKEIPSERQTEEKNKITLLHYEEMTYLKALNKDTEQYFDSLLAEEKNMLTELCKKTPLTQKTVKELAETLRKDRLISTQLSLQKNSERYFDATECIVPEDFIAKAMAAASLGCSLETTEKTIDSITKDLHQTLSKNIDHYDYGKAFEVGEVITEKCIKNCKEMKNQEYEAAELAKKLEQKQQELKKNPINLLMELLNKNDLSNRTIGGYER